MIDEVPTHRSSIRNHPSGGESGRTDYTARAARGRHWHWVRFSPDRLVTWDNFKLRRG